MWTISSTPMNFMTRRLARENPETDVARSVHAEKSKIILVMPAASKFLAGQLGSTELSNLWSLKINISVRFDCFYN